MIAAAWRRAFAPPDLRPIYDWARDGNVICHPPLTRHGPLDCSSERHFLAPLDALYDDRVREVNIRAPVRGGKTLIGDAWTCHIIKRDPGPTRIAFQDDQIAKEHAESRTRKFLQSLGVDDLRPENRHEDRTQVILFTHMPLYIQGPALGKLQSKGFRNMWLDEVWLYAGGKIEEARGRLGDYFKIGLSKLLCTSQGGVIDSDWSTHYATGEQNEWAVACQKCGRHQQPGWHREREDGSVWGIMWEEVADTEGLWDIDACLPTVRYECQFADCRHPHIDTAKTKSEWNRTGQYERVGPERVYAKSFHWNAIIDFPWVELLRLYLAARNEARQGSTKSLVIWVQKRMAEDYDPGRWTSTEKLPRVDLDPKWEGEKYRFMTVDVQEGHFWAVVRSWGANESRLLWAGRLHTWQDLERKQAEFGVKEPCVFVDCSFNRREVYANCAAHCRLMRRAGHISWVGWTALDGEEKERKNFRWKKKDGTTVLLPFSWPPNYGDPGLGTREKGKRFCPVLQWSNSWIKEILQSYRDGTAAGVRWLAYAGVGDDWQQHMFGERQITVRDNYGQPRQKWERIGKRRCDLWDCEAMQLVAAYRAGLMGERVE